MPLQQFKGYYVDYRCKQFRSVATFPDTIEFIDFKSDKGDALLVEMIEAGLVPGDKINQCI